MRPKDFQEATARRIVEIFEKEKQNRVLLADEVGLGKTIVARAVVGKVSDWHRKMGDKHFKVVYICSNINIANQNSKKLGIRDEDCLRVSESRLSMQHLKIYQNQGRGHSFQQLIPLTPATSFSMTGGCGNQEERALMFVLLRRLPAFRELSGFSDFMRYYELKNWDYFVNLYEGQVVSCDENGSGYISVMTAALNQAIPNEMIREIQAICHKAAPEDRWRSRDMINSLRRIFAQISLDKLEPDLVIMDEFQRFRDLIAPADDETGMLSKKFLQDSATKVLLLSATPYKPYSTLEEIGQNESFDHYREFMQVMDFLLYDARKNAEFKSVWRDFSHSLSELNTDRLTVLYANKSNAENALYGSICRTERFRAGMIDASKAAEIEIGRNDILSFAEMQRFLNEYNIGNVPIDYVKSAPYLLSFMESYKLKENIVKQYKARPNAQLLKHYKTMLLRKSDLNTYKKVDSGNARLQYLMDTVFDGGRSGMEKLLWLPPSKPYYKTAGVFRGGSPLSKVLVFSSWEMVPRMIASMLSYEAERLNCVKINENKENKPKRYFAADSLDADSKRKRRIVVVRLRDYAEKVVSYPCKKLSELYDPLEYLGRGLDSVQKDVAKKVQALLGQIKIKYGLSEGRGSAKDYFNIMYCLFDGFEGEMPSVIPHNAETVFTNIAIASPAVCAYRLFKNDEQADALAENFVSLFNKTESMDILDVLYGKNDDFYYEAVLRYCVEGNLQAVLDEWAYVLGEKGDDLLESMQGSFLGTASVQVDTYESFSGQSAKPRMRNHFAVGYFNARLDDKNVQRTESIRLAFNSPFRPFVLATTSIGQEGLDFHLYCRKICHWNLPSNPVDLEQREGRINRYLCLAIRQSIAQKYGSIAFHTDVWDEIFHAASEAEKQDLSDLVPFWCLPDDGSNTVKIERIVPMYPLSKDRLVYERLVKVLTLYRLTLGQPRQEELLDAIHAAELDDEALDKLFINLSPYFRNGQACGEKVETLI
ncbi:MAG: DEAD/DEAH box helicase [Oscillospiraceae bacterium]|nr:DEAD/DEAH box helicase [Oscillospiraceae bacterium]